jgi:hypothetical protein
LKAPRRGRSAGSLGGNLIDRIESSKFDVVVKELEEKGLNLIDRIERELREVLLYPAGLKVDCLNRI